MLAQSCRRGRGGPGKSQSYFSFLLSLYLFFFAFYYFSAAKETKTPMVNIIHYSSSDPALYIYNILYGVAVATFLSQSVHACIFQPAACVYVFCFHQKANADRLLNDKPTTILLQWTSSVLARKLCIRSTTSTHTFTHTYFWTNIYTLHREPMYMRH